MDSLSHSDSVMFFRIEQYFLSRLNVTLILTGNCFSLLAFRVSGMETIVTRSSVIEHVILFSVVYTLHANIENRIKTGK